jgi:hypothetical protein
MKAVVKTERKRGATFMDVPAPKITHDDEILVKVKAAAICGTDYKKFWVLLFQGPFDIQHSRSVMVLKICIVQSDLRVPDFKREYKRKLLRLDYILKSFWLRCKKCINKNYVVLQGDRKLFTSLNTV